MYLEPRLQGLNLSLHPLVFLLDKFELLVLLNNFGCQLFGEVLVVDIIFLLISIAGSLAGITGMMLAIPAYSLLRVVAKEFLSGFKVIQSLTKSL